MSIHIPENTDISGLGRTPRSGKNRSVGATRARRNQMFTVLDFLPPERRCQNGQIIPAWDKCLEDYQISPPGQARKAEFGLGSLSKSFINKLKATIVKKKPVNAAPVRPVVTGAVGGQAVGSGVWAALFGPVVAAPLITNPSTDGHVVTQAEVDASSKNNCEIGGGTWVPAKFTSSGRKRLGLKRVPSHCQPKAKLSDCGCGE